MATRVLLVDDAVAVRRRLRSGLALRGFDPEEAGDGLDALRRLERGAREGRPFAGVLLGAALADIEGLKLLTVIRSRYPALRVVLLSGTRDAGLEEAARARGADGVLQVSAPEGEVAAALAGSPEAEGPTGALRAAYVFLRLEDGLDPVAVLHALEAGPGVVWCDAVRDPEFRIALLVHAGDGEDGAARAAALAARVPGIASWESIPVRTPSLSEDLGPFVHDYRREHGGDATFYRTPGRATAYALVDVSPAALESLYVRLYFLGEVVEIDAALSGDRLILLLQADDFEGIRRAVSGRIRGLEGVVRIHEMRVIPFERS
ncbi:MAG: response regulator [Deltaproteobacteria bacterium]|nr:response regulator [Deltaproteobacteria bacterium]